MSLEHAPKEHSRKLRAPAAADYLGLSTSTLAKMRLRGDGPPYSKCGPRIVLYDIADLETYLASRRRHSTSEDLDHR
jgi:predicted DNA-binding transcriptional regulator AlpA